MIKDNKNYDKIKKDIYNKNKFDKIKDNIDNNNLCCENICISKLNIDLKKLNKKIKKKNKFIKKLNNKLSLFKKDIYDINLRHKAEVDNIIKSNENNINKIYKYSLEKFSKDLLPIIDNLKSSIIVCKDKNVNSFVNYKGIKLTLKNFLFVLKKFGILSLNTKFNKFDPNFHQAISVVYTKKKSENNVIIEILQDGYLLNNRLLRPSIVKILKYKKNYKK